MSPTKPSTGPATGPAGRATDDRSAEDDHGEESHGEESHGEDRRAQILAAAIRVLARDGLARATTRAIAAEASINQATLLYYAGSKDALLMAVLREMMRATRALARAAIPDGVGPREAIRQCVTAFWEHVEAAPELEVMQYELTLYALRHGDAAWLAREQYAGYGAVVEDLLRDTYIAAGETCALPFDALARFIVGGLDGLILQFVSDRDTARARRDRDTLIAAVLALANGANTPDAGGLPAPPARGAGGEVFRLPSPRGRGVGGEVRPREETRP